MATMTMNEQRPQVWVVVTTFNGKRFLDQCFGTLGSTDYPNLRLLLLDNGSTDDSVEFVRDNFPRVEILSLSANENIALACNRGVEFALTRGAQYVAVLNDDIEVPDSRWLGHAISLAESDHLVGMVGFHEVNPPASVVIPESVEATDVDYVRGFAIVIRSRVLEDVGLFDPAYTGIAVEDDLESRMMEAGYRIKQLSIPVFHHGGGTMRKYRLRTAYLQMRDGLRFSLKNRGFVRAAMRVGRIVDVACNPWPFTFDPNDNAHNRMRRGGNLFINGLACCCAVTWNLIHLPQTLRCRRCDARGIQLARTRLRDSVREQTLENHFA